jgi:hypothetical protein
VRISVSKTQRKILWGGNKKFGNYKLKEKLETICVKVMKREKTNKEKRGIRGRRE